MTFGKHLFKYLHCRPNLHVCTLEQNQKIFHKKEKKGPSHLPIKKRTILIFPCSFEGDAISDEADEEATVD